MFNTSTMKKTDLTNTKQILFDVSNQKSVSVIISKDITGYSTVDGRKIVKAGTPINGILTLRRTPMTAAVKASEGVTAKKAIGVLLHDVDITDGNANASLLIWGFINVNRLDPSVQTIIANFADDLDGKVWLLSDI